MQLHDDTNKMTREDIMRELELLPVCQSASFAFG
jgi:hypothetical protein